jgi:hypothetical protein
MASTIWLIPEGQNEPEIVAAILRKKYPQVRVRPLYPPGKKDTHSLSRLAKHIELLIEQALENRQRGDCIAVLHDADLLSRPGGRADYDHIRQVCRRYADEVRLVLAKDEIESWLLADAGFCKWLGTAPKNCDSEIRPSKRLEYLLNNNRRYAVERRI